jgi:hypothetical protein
MDKKAVVGMRKRCQAEYGDGGRSTNGDFRRNRAEKRPPQAR